jgi:hypothetical protein
MKPNPIINNLKFCAFCAFLWLPDLLQIIFLLCIYVFIGYPVADAKSRCDIYAAVFYFHLIN